MGRYFKALQYKTPNPKQSRQMKRFELGDSVLINSDNMEVLKSLPDNSIDSVVTDPPYGLNFMGKKWDYDVPKVELWQEVLRVLKPGGHLLCACGTRTQHRMVVNIEDAGFEIRDVISWVYGSGFPKSLNIGKAIDKIQGNERRITELNPNYRPESGSKGFKGESNFRQSEGMKFVSRGTSEYEGWGTALKPACEFFTLARKPISETNIAENVLRWGTGGINIDESRVGTDGARNNGSNPDKDGYSKNDIYGKFKATEKVVYNIGRFPANFIHDGSAEVVGLFPESKSIQSIRDNGEGERKSKIVYGNINKLETVRGHNDQVSAARFFYCAKASQSERNEGLEGFDSINTKDGRKTEIDNPFQRGETLRQNHHPTVKPIALMQYLIRLITPPNGIVLDCFAGSGTTGIAAVREGKQFILIEREEEYCEIIKARVKNAYNKQQPELFEAVNAI